jgi:pyruvate dehydrogenase E2 component (dihydrolipoamide acetyltransferase)
VARTIELTVPDIGNFKDIPVIEVLVAPGQSIAKDAPLVMLESEKATMEVPANAGGVIKDVRVKVGDKVSQGAVIATAEVEDAQPATNGHAQTAPAQPAEPAPPPAQKGAGIELIVPDIGNFAEIPVIEVLVAPGQSVAKDAPLVVLESEKATMEVPASAAGIVKDVRVKVGDKVSKGTVIASLEGAAAPAPAAGAPPASRASAPTTATATAARPVAPSPATLVPPSGNGSSGAAAGGRSAVHASPSIRRFARELGVDLGSVRGSGPNGRITRDDVQDFVKRALTGAPVAQAAPGAGFALPAWPKVDFAQFGPVERKALTRIQRISGPALTRNWVMIPHVTQNDDADVTELEEFRKAVNAEQKEAKVTMLAFLMKAAVAALARFPDFNSSLDGEELVVKGYYHIGFAADTPQGLVVPVVRDCDRKGVLEIARDTAELAGKARDGKLAATDMTGGTFTISSLGGIGGSNFTPIINAPEVAILGASRTSMKPVWDGTAFVPRLMLPLSLSYDHRVIDGAKGARFVTYLVGVLGDMRRTLL